MASRTPAPTGDPLTPPVPVTAALLRAAFEAATEAMLLCSATDHTILLANPAACALVPGLRPGDPLTRAPLPELAAAATGGHDSFRSHRQTRLLYGRRRDLDADHYAWFLRDPTPERDSSTPPETERDSSTPPETERESSTLPETERESSVLPETERESSVLPETERARTAVLADAAGHGRAQAGITAVLRADLLPPPLPETEGFDLSGSYQAAHEPDRSGGDFYEVFGPSGASTDTMVALGDVCGTGPEADVLAGKVRQTLRALRLVRTGPETMLRVLNQTLTESGPGQRFVTLVIGSITRAGHGRIRLELAAGGHPPPLVLRADGTVEEVPASGTLIGVLPRTSVHPATTELGPGELCLLHSDGLTGARGGPTGCEQLGEARLRHALAACAGLPGTVTLERLRRLACDWSHGDAGDDIAMLAIRAHTRTPLSLRGGGAPNQSPYLLAARRGDRRARPRA